MIAYRTPRLGVVPPRHQHQASPPSPSGICGILWVVQSIDLWLVSHEVQYSDR